MIELLNGLPVFEALVDDEGTGMTCISLVHDPAVERNFLAFSEKKPMSFSVNSDEKRLILGPVMIADLPIYRRNEEMGEYYIVYTADTIKKMAQKYLSEGFQNKISVVHNGELLEGIEMTQWFIKDSANGINPSSFSDLSDGTLFCEFHVLNDEVWEFIKSGELLGFSLEGIFGVEPKQEKFEKTEVDYEKECRSLINKIYNKLN